MSRIGNNPIIIPEGVSVEIQPNLFSVKGKLGELSQPYDLVSVEQTDNTLTLKRENESKPAKAKHGLYRALFFNMIEGVSKGWTKELELVGVGYRAKNQGQKLELALGFSHNIVSGRGRDPADSESSGQAESSRPALMPWVGVPWCLRHRVSVPK